MSRSVKTRLAEIKRLEERAAKDLQRAGAERARIMAPTRNKIRDLFAERLDLFLKDRFEEVVGRGLDRAEFARAVDALLTRSLMGDAGAVEDIEDDEDFDEELLNAFAEEKSGASASS